MKLITLKNLRSNRLKNFKWKWLYGLCSANRAFANVRVKLKFEKKLKNYLEGYEKTDYCGVSLIVDGKEYCRTPYKKFTAPPVLDMFDHFGKKHSEKYQVVGQIFKIKWNKNTCKKRNHMFAQVGPIFIAYKGYTDIISKNVIYSFFKNLFLSKIFHYFMRTMTNKK